MSKYTKGLQIVVTGTITLEEYKRREAAGQPIPGRSAVVARKRSGLLAQRAETRVRHAAGCGSLRGSDD